MGFLSGILNNWPLALGPLSRCSNLLIPVWLMALLVSLVIKLRLIVGGLLVRLHRQWTA